MKLRELTESNSKALIEVYLEFLRIVSREDHRLSATTIQYLIAGNGAGVFLNVTLAGIFSQSHIPLSDSVLSSSVFGLGTLFGFGALFLLTVAASQRTSHWGNTIEQLVRNNMDIENVQGWGLGKRGERILRIALGATVLAFIGGSVSSGLSVLGMQPH